MVTEDGPSAGHPHPGPAHRPGSCRKAWDRGLPTQGVVPPLGPARRLPGDRRLSSCWTPGGVASPLLWAPALQERFPFLEISRGALLGSSLSRARKPLPGDPTAEAQQLTYSLIPGNRAVGRHLGSNPLLTERHHGQGVLKLFVPLFSNLQNGDNKSYLLR